MGHDVKVRPHHDLLNLAFYHKGVIEGKRANDNHEAIALDCMSCLVALAFSVEGLINFVGAEKVPDWKERASFKDKLKLLDKTLPLGVDERKDPFSTVVQLKLIRDQMAHGKPIERKRKVSSRAAMAQDLRAPWDDYLEPDFTLNAFAQVKDFESKLLAAAGIEMWDTLTCGSGVYA